MAKTIQPQSAACVTGPRFYRSFASYQIPFRPVDEWDYARTAGVAAYSVAYHDTSERVVRFTKVQLVRPSKELTEVHLKGPAVPGAPVYFAVAHDDGGEPVVGERIEYPDTADRTDYFVGAVGPSGRSAEVVRLVKQVAFTDLYAYWPAGPLRERWNFRPGQPPVTEFYGPDGNRIAEPTPFEWTVAYDSGMLELNAGRYREARELLTKALASAEQEEYLHGVAESLNRLARADLGEAEHAPAQKREFATAAIAKAKRAFLLWRALANPNGLMSSWWSIGHAERMLAQASRAEGDTEEATRRYQAARQCLNKIVPLGEQGGEWENVQDAYKALSELANEFEQAQDATDANEGIRTAQRHLATVPAG